VILSGWNQEKIALPQGIGTALGAAKNVACINVSKFIKIVGFFGIGKTGRNSQRFNGNQILYDKLFFNLITEVFFQFTVPSFSFRLTRRNNKIKKWEKKLIIISSFILYYFCAVFYLVVKMLIC